MLHAYLLSLLPQSLFRRTWAIPNIFEKVILKKVFSKIRGQGEFCKGPKNVIIECYNMNVATGHYNMKKGLEQRIEISGKS